MSQVSYKTLTPIFLFALLTACSDGDRNASDKAGDWPTGLTAPVAGATFSLNETHFPGTLQDYREGKHQGFDFFNGLSGRPLAADEPVVAVADGEIIRSDHDYEAPDQSWLSYYSDLATEAGYVGEYALDQIRGRQIWIRHEQGHVSRYAHLSEVNPNLQPGAAVKKGQAIALMGRSGIPTNNDQPEPAPRLHFELWSPDGTRFLGEGLTPLESHQLIAAVFSEDALPRYAQRIVRRVEAGETPPESYPPSELPKTGFNIDPPASIPAGNAFAVPVTWQGDDFAVDDFFASLDGRPLGIIDAGNGAWVLGAVQLASAGQESQLIVGAVDSYGQTLSGGHTLEIDPPLSNPPPREVSPAMMDRYTEANQETEARKLGPVHAQSLQLRDPLWNQPFRLPLEGNVVATYGQRLFHGMLRPSHPLPGAEIRPEESVGVVRAGNDGLVALNETLPIRGKTIALVHGGGVVSIYAHLDDVAVSEGDRVSRGQRIGTIELGDQPEDTRLRAEIHVAGVPSQPQQWLEQVLPVN